MGVIFLKIIAWSLYFVFHLCSFWELKEEEEIRQKELELDRLELETKKEKFRLGTKESSSS